MSPQPQPAPGELPNVYLDHVTFRSASPSEIEIVGDPPASNGSALLVANLDTVSDVRTVRVDRGAFRATLPGRMGDRLLILAVGGPGELGFPSHVVADARARVAEDCVKHTTFVESLIVVTRGASHGTVRVDNRCPSAVTLAMSAIGGSATGGAPVTLQPNATGTVAVQFKAPLSAPMAVVLRDASGAPRLGTFFHPADPASTE